MLVNLNIDLLRTFVTVADLNSFTNAAKILFRSQPAISLQIQKLEDLTGTALCRRLKGSIELTPAGRTIYEYARRILELHDEMQAHVPQKEYNPRVIRMGTPDDYAQSFLPKILEAFSGWIPNVELEIVSDISSRLSDLLRDGKLDLVLGTAPSPFAEGRELRREKLRWVAGPGGITPFLDSPQLPLAMFPDGCVFRTRALKALSGMRRPFSIIHSSNSFTALRTILMAGRGVSVLAESTIDSDLVILDESAGLPDLGSVSIFVEVGRLGQVTKLCDVLARTIEAVLGSPDMPAREPADYAARPSSARPAFNFPVLAPAE